MIIENNTSLQSFNTFGIDATARHFVEINSSKELDVLRKEPVFQNNERLILGGGSNMLIVSDYEGLVLKNNITGITNIKEDEDYVWIEAGAGENWHAFVLNVIDRGLGGVENLSLIPGTVGAAPIQNIGAYGVELKDTFERLTAYNFENGSLETFDKEACAFGYRDSYFKRGGKHKYMIISVVLRLRKHPVFHVDYGAIKNTLAQHQIKELSVKAISDAVIEIRQSKLPDPKEIGNSGSFFKNPELPVQEFEQLKFSFPNVPGYQISDNLVKVPAGWLIDQAGWKGKNFGKYGVHDKQALVLVNYGGASGKQIWELALKIRDSVQEKFGVTLSPEVNIIGEC